MGGIYIQAYHIIIYPKSLLFLSFRERKHLYSSSHHSKLTFNSKSGPLRRLSQACKRIDIFMCGESLYQPNGNCAFSFTKRSRRYAEIVKNKKEICQMTLGHSIWDGSTSKTKWRKDQAAMWINEAAVSCTLSESTYGLHLNNSAWYTREESIIILARNRKTEVNFIRGFTHNYSQNLKNYQMIYCRAALTAVYALLGASVYPWMWKRVKSQIRTAIQF